MRVTIAPCPVRSGYSLIELSMVLVVLGLIVGGILASRTLIHAYELRSVAAEADKIIAAAKTFQLKYKYLPGDIPFATDIWGIAAGATGNDATCRDAPAAYDKKTCNGNGNGRIESALLWPGGMETLRFWQHLSNAEMIEGSFTGRYAGSSTKDKTNSFPSKMPNTIWSILCFFDKSGSIPPQFFDGVYGNTIWAYQSPDDGLSPPQAVLTNADMYYIDKKYDDGMPATGTLVAYAPTGKVLSDCATDSVAVTTSDLTAQYKILTSEPVCILGFRDTF